MSAFDDVKTLVTEIKADINDLKNSLPTEGGLSSEQVTELKASLAEIAGLHTPTPTEPPAEPV